MPSLALAPTLPRRFSSVNEASLSQECAAAFLDVPVEFVSELTHLRQLPYSLVDGEKRFRRSDLVVYKQDFERLLEEDSKSPLSEVWDLPIFHETFFLKEVPETR